MIKNTAASASPRFFRASIELLASNGFPLQSKVVHITASNESDAQAIAEHFAHSIDGGPVSPSVMSLDLYPMDPIELLDLDQVEVMLDVRYLPFDHPATMTRSGALH